ncbi:MAG: hypothetical protein Q8896_08815, partial [Bacteroidota bacterium]|nr:hypothetical protein [Bacteroidota bacterium]
GTYKRLGRLPEGNYSLCVWFIDATTGRVIPGSVCNPFTIQGINPPLLLAPASGANWSEYFSHSSDKGLSGWCLNFSENPPQHETIADLVKLPFTSLPPVLDFGETNRHILYASDLHPISRIQSGPNVEQYVRYHWMNSQIGTSQASQAGLNFQWTPPMPSAPSGVQYDLRIVPVLPGQTAQQALLTATPVFEKDGISATIYDGTDLIRQHYFDFSSRNTDNFAWSVEAHDAGGHAIGANNGWAVPNIFTIGKNDTPPYTSGISTESFFDVFDRIDSPNVSGATSTEHEPCPYTYRFYKRNLVTECVNGWRKVYQVWGVFTCSLWKGHSGPHHGTVMDVYVYLGAGSCNDDEKGEPEPPKEKIIKEKDLHKIPTREEADKKEADEKKKDGGKDSGGDSGGDHGSGKTPGGDTGGSGNNGTDPGPGGGLVPGAGGPAVKEQCPEVKLTTLRTVIGSWRKVSTEVKHAAYRKTVVAWAIVTWQRDIWNVILVQHCTLEKGHGGPHQWDAGHIEWQKYGSIKEEVTYGVGEAQTEPKNHWSDGPNTGPHEDPPRNAIFR